MEDAGIVQRCVLPRPSGAVVYELTEYGRDLEDVVLRLGRWGARSLGDPRPDEIVTVDSLVTALRTTFHPDAARDLQIGYELRLGGIVLHARVDHGTLTAAGGPLAGADLIIETGPALKALMADEISPAEAIANRSVHLTGDPALLDQFVAVFAIDAPPAARAA
jgi:hypothetical protein